MEVREEQEGSSTSKQPSVYGRLVKSLTFHNTASSVNFPQHSTHVVEALASLPLLKRLKCSSSRTDAWDLLWNCSKLLSAVASSPSALEILIIDGCRFTGTIVSPLLPKWPLRVLEIRRTDGQLRGGSLAPVLVNGTLERLAIVDAIKTLWNAFDKVGSEPTRLKKLEIGEYRKIMDDGLKKVISASPELEELDLDVFKFSVGLQMLADLRAVLAVSTLTLCNPQHTLAVLLPKLAHLRHLRIICPRLSTNAQTWKAVCANCSLAFVQLQAQWGKSVPTVGKLVSRCAGPDVVVRYSGMEKKATPSGSASSSTVTSRNSKVGSSIK